MVAERAELAVVAAELLEMGDDPVEGVDVADHGSQRGHELVALPGHVHGEHVAHFGMGEEERGVEVQGHLLAVGGDQTPVLLQPVGVDHVCGVRLR